jgi:alanine racemase
MFSTSSNDKRGLRTWIEIDTSALRSNILTFRKLIGQKAKPRTVPRSGSGVGVKLMAVVKSNAYGHALWEFAAACEKLFRSRTEPVEGQAHSASSGQSMRGIDWFGVDSFIEALRLRKEGIRKPILVLGYTLPAFFPEAVKRDIGLTISTFESIKALKKLKRQPRIHIEIDTGMHRQGFLANQVPAAIRELKKAKLFKEIEGVYTHFAAAKDRTYPFYTKEQIKKFEAAYLQFEAAGSLPFLRHASATAGAILHPEAHYDMVRIGIGLYGLWPSKEIMIQHALPGEQDKQQAITLRPILSWKAIVSEIKRIPPGAHIGYDLTERVTRTTTIAIVPVGYWHGVDRGLSSIGNVLIRGKRAKILGRVSMDMIVVDVTDVDRGRGQNLRVKVGDEAVLIGKQGNEEISAYEWAEKLSTTHYEIITRINPLIRRIYL